jgi:quercetin dioxygenase-like cupin family protein
MDDAEPRGQDPTHTDPDKYRPIFENDVVRVLEYHDTPGSRTSPHQHPDSVMYTLSDFQRRLHFADGTRDVSMPAGQAFWLPAQIHAGENIGSTDTRVLFVELKDSTSAPVQSIDAAPA